jgi:hypothetical protein
MNAAYVFLIFNGSDFFRSKMWFMEDFAYHEALGFYGAYYDIIPGSFWVYDCKKRHTYVYRFKAFLKAEAV